MSKRCFLGPVEHVGSAKVGNMKGDRAGLREDKDARTVIKEHAGEG